MSTSAFDERSPHTVALGSIVDRLEAVELRIREAEAERTALMAEVLDLAAAESDRIVSTPQGAQAELAYRAVRAEVSACLHQSESATERQLSHAYTLTRDYREVFRAYRGGEISRQHTAVIIDAGAIIASGLGGPDAPGVIDRRSAYEQAVLIYAVTETPNRLRPIARRLAEQYVERPLDERHVEARARRRVCVIDAEDGMADLHAHVPAVEAYAIRDRLTRIARSVQRAVALSGSGPSRTREETRTDVFTDLLLNGTVSSAAGVGGDIAPVIRARVQVTLGDSHLAEVEREIPRGFAEHVDRGEGSRATLLSPPLLQGYGPIDTASARRLAGESEHWEAIHEDPRSGAVLSVERYRPSERMRRLLGARDQHCRFPGCRQPLHRCDVDHTIDAARGGPTATDNLAHLCRGHHTLKHHSGWQVEQLVGGEMCWTSPAGRRYSDLPDGAMRRRRPDRPPGRVRFTTGDPMRAALEPADPDFADPTGSLPPPGVPF